MSLRCPLPEIRTFIAALVQSESFGVPIGPLLRTHAADIRIRQRQAAQLRAQKAPVKMLVPMILCVFPALLVVVAGPALLTIRQTLLA
jgi:tight adherence protein C